MKDKIKFRVDETENGWNLSLIYANCKSEELRIFLEEMKLNMRMQLVYGNK